MTAAETTLSRKPAEQAPAITTDLLGAHDPWLGVPPRERAIRLYALADAMPARSEARQALMRDAAAAQRLAEQTVDRALAIKARRDEKRAETIRRVRAAGRVGAP